MTTATSNPPTIPYDELVQARNDSGVAMYNYNAMKLGIFGSNCSHGLMATHAETTYELTWEHTEKIAKLADQLGFEAMLPVARYRGMGGETNFNGENFETHTWADRKSTRLNSSHVKISYAVFCLKKKTIAK